MTLALLTSAPAGLTLKVITLFPNIQIYNKCLTKYSPASPDLQGIQQSFAGLFPGIPHASHIRMGPVPEKAGPVYDLCLNIKTLVNIFYETLL